MHALQNSMMLAADRMANSIAKPRLATISGYDPGTYMAKVQLQPEGVETGWLPLGSPFVGNGFGIFAGPAIGDQVEVQFPDGDLSSGVVSMRFYSDAARPLSAASGEVWIVHQSGSFLKLHNDGSVELTATQNLRISAGGYASITSPSIIDLNAPQVNAQNALTAGNGASGMIVDVNGKTATFVAGICTNIS